MYAKAKACQRLAVTGDGSAAPALEPLLTDPGVIGSTGKRHDPEAIGPREKLRHGDDVGVARAGSSALARIRPTM